MFDPDLCPADCSDLIMIQKDNSPTFFCKCHNKRLQRKFGRVFKCDNCVKEIKKEN